MRSTADPDSVRRNCRAARDSSPRSVNVVTTATATSCPTAAGRRARRPDECEEPTISSQLDPQIGPYDHLQGEAGAELSLVEYGDFECPYCREAAPVIEKVREELGDRLMFAFRHFPLFELHPHSLAAACAAEAASVYGRFWPMHARLYAPGPPRLTQRDLREHAEAIGLDDPDKAIWPASQNFEDRVEADFNSGVRSGVRGTPTLFVNGEQYRGPVSVDALLDALTS
ncbi:MAG TPA: thioredoxin domain-containing protein [Pseudonocardia sp.]|jgi:protein-disulfide isomerase|nr:thioredoxin domain-containing protein [Pseudonocardia sp.]